MALERHYPPPIPHLSVVPPTPADSLSIFTTTLEHHARRAKDGFLRLVNPERRERRDPLEGPRYILDRQSKFNHGRRWTLFSDVDRTLVDGITPFSPELTRNIQEKSWLVVYNTGNDLESVISMVRNGQLRFPHIVTETISGPIYYLKKEIIQALEEGMMQPSQLRQEHFVLDSNFKRRLDRRFGSREDVIEQVGQMIGVLNRNYGDFDFNYRGKNRRYPTEDKAKYRVRVGYNLPHDADARRRHDFRTALEAEAQRRFKGKLRYEEFQDPGRDGDFDVKGMIIPWGKEEAIRYLRHDLTSKLGINGGMIAGDSGNDPILNEQLGCDLWRLLVGTQQPDLLLNRALRAYELHDIDPHRNIHRVILGKDWNGKTRRLNLEHAIFVIDKNSGRRSSQSVAYGLRLMELAWKQHEKAQGWKDDDKDTLTIAEIQPPSLAKFSFAA